MKKYIILVIMSLIIANLFIYVTTSYAPIADKYRYSTMKLGENLNENFGEITSEVEINQSFVAKYNNLSGLAIFVSTFNRSNTGETTVNILDEKRNVLRTVELENSDLNDNEYTEIKFAPIEGTKNKVLFINVSSGSAVGNNAITMWKDLRQSPNTKLSVNNEFMDGTLVGNTTYENKIDMSSRIIINFVVFLLNFLTLGLFRFLRKR